MASITIGEIPSPSDAIKLDMLPPSDPNLLTGIELFPFLVLIFAEVISIVLNRYFFFIVIPFSSSISYIDLAGFHTIRCDSTTAAVSYISSIDLVITLFSSSTY